MARTIQIKRGLEKNLPVLKPGEQAFTTDTKKVFVGSDEGNIDITNSVDTTKLATKTELSTVTTQLADEMKYSNQVDFVELIKNRVSYTKMYFQKTSDTSFMISLGEGNNRPTYSFIKDARDDFFRWYEGNIGKTSLSEVSYGDPTNLTDTWTTTYPPKYYTTKVGATFTAKAKGKAIYMRHTKANNGGLWSIVVNGDTANPVLVSCWAETEETYALTLLRDDLDPNAEHTIVGTFQGADPAHPVGTPRGYVNTTHNAHPKGAAVGMDESVIKDKGIFYGSSNKEMAFRIQYGSNSNWIPEHELTGTAFQYKPLQIVLDGKSYTLDTVGSKLIECNDCKLVQDLYASINSENVADIYLTHHIDKSGVLNWSGRFKATKALTANIMYPLMLVFDGANINEVLTSIGNSKVSTEDDSNYYFNEKDKLLSCVGISSVNSNLVGAGTIEHQAKTMRVGKTIGKPTESDRFRFWQRATSPKFYFTSAHFLPFAVGDTYTWFAKTTVAKIENIYDLLKG